MTWYEALAVLAVGLGAGVLSGMFGVGGAVLTTPGIRVLGATPIEAVGSTIPAILPGALSGTWRYSRAGIVNWRVGLVCGATGSVLAVVGAWVSDLVNAHLLMVLTAVLAGWGGVSTARSGRAGGAASEEVGEAAREAARVVAEDGAATVAAGSATTVASAHLGTATLALVGSCAGFLAGLLGVGGGVVMVPAFTAVLRIPIKEAVASSLVAVAIFSVPALITHVTLGHVNWAFALLLMVGSVPGAQLGSHLTLGSSERTIRVLFGGFLVVLAVVYGSAELAAL
jgi:hypothetical protein